MDIAFFMGLTAGFLLGIGFSLFICRNIKKNVYEGMIDAINHSVSENKQYRKDDDDANFWKPKGWKPNE